MLFEKLTDRYGISMRLANYLIDSLIELLLSMCGNLVLLMFVYECGKHIELTRNHISDFQGK